MAILTFTQALTLFELIHRPWAKAFVVASPNPTSIQKINAELGIQLPQSIITFASSCNIYGAWFAGLGEDYDNQLHILNTNRIFRSPDSFDRLIPDWLVILNHGHDGDCDCLDTRNYNPITGEYPIVFWSDGVGETFEIGKPDPGFPEFLENMLLESMKHLKRSQKREAEQIVFGSQ